MPLLIGGATTSDKHTAVKIAPHYEHGVVHVLDASRSVGVVDRLINPELKPNFIQKNTELQSKLVSKFEERQITLVPYEEAFEKRFATDWNTVDIPNPEFTGTRTVGTDGSKNDIKIGLDEIAKFIDWTPFFMSWELHGKYPRILDDDVVGEEARKVFEDGRSILQRIIDENLLEARGMFGFWPANSERDDILLYTDENRTEEICRFPMLRQQWQRKGIEHFRSLADYVAPVDSGRADYIGGFAVTTGHGCDELAAAYRKEMDDYNAIMVAAIADRLAEAFAEMMHQRARVAWGFGAQESFSNEELIRESYRGIRPAAGYPACPDHTEKSTLWNLMDVENKTGIRLTESFAMWPGAAVSGLYFAHPESRYFAINRIARDQLKNYAQRKGQTLEEAERWLAPIL